MRLAMLAAALVSGLALVACGGEESAAPLTLEQRIPAETEAPGFEPDPMETRVVVTGLDEFAAEIAFNPVITEDDRRVFEEAGFVAAIFDTRFRPGEPGGAHVPEAPHLDVVVHQFESEEGASEAVELLHNIALRPCPETCAFDNSEFDVDGTPSAKGAQSIATQESIDQVGDTGVGEPHADYTITFADGPFAYDISLFGPPEDVSEQQLEEITKKLYERVAGAPPPESG